MPAHGYDSDSTVKVNEFTGARGAMTGRWLNIDGMEIITDQVPPGRFAWLGFEIPVSHHRIKALAEVIGVLDADDEGPDRRRVMVRFKHLFPADRVEMIRWLTEKVAA